MTTLDSLRREYDKLNPFERAAMRIDAVARQDEAAIDALKAPSLWDAFHTTGYAFDFVVLAFIAIHLSQHGERRHWLSQAMLGGMEYRKHLGKEEAGPKYDKEIERWADCAVEEDREARAWLLALEALDKETGGSCMVFARMYAAPYIQSVLDRECAEEAEYGKELDHLREQWNALTQGRPDAPSLPTHQ